MLKSALEAVHSVQAMARKKKLAAPQKAPAEKVRYLQVPLDPELDKRFEQARGKLRMDRATLGEIMVEGIVDLIEREGRISVPLRVAEWVPSAFERGAGSA